MTREIREVKRPIELIRLDIHSRMLDRSIKMLHLRTKGIVAGTPEYDKEYEAYQELKDLVNWMNREAFY